MALHTMLNLSVDESNQPLICELALSDLVGIVEANAYRETRVSRKSDRCRHTCLSLNRVVMAFQMARLDCLLSVRLSFAVPCCPRG